MTTLNDSVVINRSPESVFEWFAHFTENYRAWHKDHVLAKYPQRNNLCNLLFIVTLIGYHDRENQDVQSNVCRGYSVTGPKWIKGNNFEKGSVLYAEEYLGDKMEKLSFEITNCVRNELIEYKVLFPESFVCSGGSFSIKPSNGGSVFTATLSFRFGGLVSMAAKKRAEAIRQHMKEEGENLKVLLEEGGKNPVSMKNEEIS